MNIKFTSKPDKDSGSSKARRQPAPGPNQVLIHYRRRNADYAGWGLHIWGRVAHHVTWNNPLKPGGQDEFGLYWLIDLMPRAGALHYVVHQVDLKDPGPDQHLDIQQMGREIWIVEGTGTQFTDPAAAVEHLLIRSIGDIRSEAKAHWITSDILVWPGYFGPEASYRLHHDPDGTLQLTVSGVQNGQWLDLKFVSQGLSPELAERFPHLQTAAVFRVPEAGRPALGKILQGQIAVSAIAPDGSALRATGVQIAGVLDDLYAFDGRLGVSFNGEGVPQLAVWAPTARSVHLLLFPNSEPPSAPTRLPMQRDAGSGVWQIRGEKSWDRAFYLYQVEVFVPQEGRICLNEVTDPYALSLSTNSRRSQIVDLLAPDLKPAGWDNLRKPALAHFADIVLYELHVRDFSAFEPEIPAEWRGGYLAFTAPGSAGVAHLQKLAEAGITHLHLLPLADIATVNEDKRSWASPDYETLTGLPGNSPAQQAALSALRGRDGFNWGYDPFHYCVPEGSYATDPDGPARILELRQMVKALNEMGLRVVMDVVYNHTFAAGQSPESVLDKIVPGYYYRLDLEGRILNTTCCMNTASEHAMMEKLIIDSLHIWAENYKIDGFRFDLMGHHLVKNMLRIRDSLDSLTIEQHGVDGQLIYVYGEGWNFGEMANSARGANGHQLNMSGTGIGTFNDRFRDAVRGGGPFGGLEQQGWISGLFTDPNESDRRPKDVQFGLLLESTDWLRLSLAGNLADYPLMGADGQTLNGWQIPYNGQPAGYTRLPSENVAYVSAHDNETLFDAIQYKAPAHAGLEARLRMQNLGISLLALSQGVPFFHAGIELLRSKSLDRDSYNSGDWFNRLDYTYRTNNWAVGLPPEEKNGANWPRMVLLLANESLKPAQDMIQGSLAHFVEMLQIRKTIGLFHLHSADEILDQVQFLNCGPDQTPGLIVMQIESPSSESSERTAAEAGSRVDSVVVLFNAAPDTVNFSVDVAVRPYSLHPIQQQSADPIVRTAQFEPAQRRFVVPGRTAAVFIQERPDIPPTEP